MVSWDIVFTPQAAKDAKRIAEAGLKPKVEKLINVLMKNPFQSPPSYEKLSGDLKGLYSRRINLQHRLIYDVYVDVKTVKILRMWTHYE